MLDEADWVIWNGTMGIVDMAALGVIEAIDGVRRASLASPYDAVGPFDLDALEAEGRLEFGACLVMSRARWQQDQVELRAEARARRQALYARLSMDGDECDYRETLDLPLDGTLDPATIRAAFRRLAKTAHPDAGGSDALYHAISDARDALLRMFEAV